MTGCGRYPPQPWYKPIAFYSAVRLGDPEQLAKIMARDPYFLTQDNGAGAPVHFATTYRQLDMVRSTLMSLHFKAVTRARLGCDLTPLFLPSFLVPATALHRIYSANANL